jgi:hypothetical protein
LNCFGLKMKLNKHAEPEMQRLKGFQEKSQFSKHGQDQEIWLQKLDVLCCFYRLSMNLVC